MLKKMMPCKFYNLNTFSPMKHLLHLLLTCDVRFAAGLWQCRVDMILLGHDPVWCTALPSVLLLDIHGFCLHLRRLTLTLRKHPERDTFSTDGVSLGVCAVRGMLMETCNMMTFIPEDNPRNISRSVLSARNTIVLLL